MTVSEDTIPIIFTPALCQLYYIDNNNTNYINLSKKIYSILNENEKGKKFLDRLSKINEGPVKTKTISNNKHFIEQMRRIIEETVKKKNYYSYKEFKQKLFSSTINFKEIAEILSDFLKNNVTYVHKEQIPTVKSLKLNIYNDDPFNLLIDEFCLTNFQNTHDVTFEFYIQDELLYEADKNNDIINNYITKNNKVFFYSNSPDILKLFKNKY